MLRRLRTNPTRGDAFQLEPTAHWVENTPAGKFIAQIDGKFHGDVVIRNLGDESVCTVVDQEVYTWAEWTPDGFAGRLDVMWGQAKSRWGLPDKSQWLLEFKGIVPDEFRNVLIQKGFSFADGL